MRNGKMLKCIPKKFLKLNWSGNKLDRKCSEKNLWNSIEVAISLTLVRSTVGIWIMYKSAILKVESSLFAKWLALFCYKIQIITEWNREKKGRRVAKLFSSNERYGNKFDLKVIRLKWALRYQKLMFLCNQNQI